MLRGGSFNNNPDIMRCAYRNNNHPDNRNNNIGFRVVVSTLFAPAGNAARAAELGVRGRGLKNGVARPWPRLRS